MIMPHATGHLFARSGHLLRVDIIAGQWTATKFTPNLTIVQQVVGTDEFVHKQILRWLRPEKQSSDRVSTAR